MTRKHAKELLPIITAFANGEEVQCLHRDKWESREDHGFTWDANRYRIVPNPRKIWVNEYKSGNLYVHTTKEDAKDCALGNCEFVACHELELPPLT